MDFNNIYYGSMNFFGQEIWITDTVKNTWIIGGFLILLAIFTRIKLKSFQEVPTGFQNVIELIVDSMNNFVKTTMGDENENFGFWFFGVMAFIMLSNLSGLIGLRPPTADLSMTLVFGLSTFVLIHFTGIRTKGIEYFKDYFKPIFILFPINLVGEIATPVSLSFRLFGNILGGYIIMGMVYGLLPWFLKLGIPAALHMYFDLFAGILQAYIFTVLSMTFIRQKMPD